MTRSEFLWHQLHSACSAEKSFKCTGAEHVGDPLRGVSFRMQCFLFSSSSPEALPCNPLQLLERREDSSFCSRDRSTCRHWSHRRMSELGREQARCARDTDSCNLVSSAFPGDRAEVQEHCDLIMRMGCPGEHVLESPLCIFLFGCLLFFIVFMGWIVYSLDQEDKMQLSLSRRDHQRSYLKILTHLYTANTTPLDFRYEVLPPRGLWCGSLGTGLKNNACYRLRFSSDGSLDGTREDDTGSYLICGRVEVNDRRLQWAEYQRIFSRDELEKGPSAGPELDAEMLREFPEVAFAVRPEAGSERPVVVSSCRLWLPEDREDCNNWSIEGLVWSATGERQAIHISMEGEYESIVQDGGSLLAVQTVGVPQLQLARKLR